MTEKPWGVSVTENHSVLVTFVQCLTVVEFSTEGRPLRHVRLPRDVLHPLHAHWLSSGHLVVSHGDGADILHRLCAFDVDQSGAATTATALDGLRSTKTKQTSRQVVLDVDELDYLVGNCSGVAMDVPGHIAVDRQTGLLLVADVNNSRVLVVDGRLRRCSVLLELAVDREFPVRLCLDDIGRRLYIAYNGAVRNGCWTAGRVLVFFFGDHCSVCSDVHRASTPCSPETVLVLNANRNVLSDACMLQREQRNQQLSYNRQDGLQTNNTYHACVAW